MGAARPAAPVTRRAVLGLGLGLGAALPAALTGCVVAGEGSGGMENTARTLNVDYATYSPLSLVIRRHGWLEEALGERGIRVNWVFSAGSNKANELLRAGALDVGSTAGSAALLNRANGAPTRVVGIASRPEWAALMVPPGSDVTDVAGLAGRSVSATRGTDPYFFVVQALQQAGVDPGEVDVQNLQHADGRTALLSGSVQAWSGLDPIMAAAERDGARFLHRDLELNTYCVLNAREDFLAEDPQTAQLVLDVYERARAWALERPEETTEILAEAAKIDPAVARTVITRRTNADVSPVPDAAFHRALEGIAPILVSLGDVDYPHQVRSALDTIVDPRFAQEATR